MPTDSIDSLRAELQSTDPARRLAAADYLLTHADVARQLAPELIEVFGRADEGLREVCLGAVENCESIDVGVGRRLIPFLAGDELQAVWAAKLLGRLGAEAAFAVDDLVKVLTKSDSIPVREEAAWALGRIGPGAKAALLTLEAAAKVDSPRLARYAKEAIGKIMAP